MRFSYGAEARGKSMRSTLIVSLFALAFLASHAAAKGCPVVGKLQVRTATAAVATSSTDFVRTGDALTFKSPSRCVAIRFSAETVVPEGESMEIGIQDSAGLRASPRTIVWASA